MGWSKIPQVIKAIRPGTKTGAESVASWKSKAAKSKLKMAKDNLEQTFKKTDTELKKLTETLKKRRKKSWKDHVDTSHPSYKKNWPPGE